MGWLLAHSLVRKAQLRWSDIHVQFTPEVAEHTVETFRRLGCATHRLARYGDGKYCNKLGQWENLRKIDADQFMFLDTDMICVSPIAELLPSDSVAGKVVDLPNPDLELLDAVFDQVGFVDRPEIIRVDATDGFTYRANCNGGFYSVPKQFAEPLFSAWRRYAQLLLDGLEILQQAGKGAHVDQIAFCMAIHQTGLRFEHLPSNLNYYVHFRGEHSWKDPERPLSVLHYHNDSLNLAGLLEPAGACEEDERWAVAEANKLISENSNLELYSKMRAERLPEQDHGFLTAAADDERDELMKDSSFVDVQDGQIEAPRFGKSNKSRISGVDAWYSLAKGQYGRWADRIGCFDDQLVRVRHEPKFKLSLDDRFFCMGSCFARNIEEHLIYRNVDVLSKKIKSPAAEYPGRPNGFVNKFSTHSMANELEWIGSAPNFDETFFAKSESGWHDLQLSPGTTPVPLERVIERRKYLTEKYFDRVRESTVLVLTLGLNEVWYDSVTERYLNAAPSFFSVRREPSRYCVNITDVSENISQLEKIYAAACSINPNLRMVVTVSPVPMSDTFSGRDVLVANMRSKATLRIAAETFALSQDAVDYFPSYDMVAMSPRNRAYEADRLHVKDEVVGGIMQEFIRLYIGLEGVPPIFNESAYCVANPDVEAAIRRSEFSSGFEHWQRHGKLEGRRLAPSSGPFAYDWLQQPES